jgi:hypothetical protein
MGSKVAKAGPLHDPTVTAQTFHHCRCRTHDRYERKATRDARG